MLPMKRLNVLVDTNSLIRASLRESDRIELFKLINLAKNNVIKFVLFEIVLDEFEKYSNTLEESLSKEIAKASKEIRNALLKCKLWNELNDINEYISNSLYQYKGEKYNQATSFIKEINKLIKSKKIKLIKSDTKRYYETQRRITRGELPKINSNDLHIIDTLEELCKKQVGTIVCFATENKQDFFKTDENGNYIKNDDGTFVIKELNYENLKGFISLKQLVRFINKQGEVHE